MIIKDKLIISFKLFSILLLLSLSGCSQKPVDNTPKDSIKRYILNSGDTLTESLKDTGMTPQLSQEIVNALSKVFNPRYCRPGDYFDIKNSLEGQLIHFQYYTSGLNYFHLEKAIDGKITASKKLRSGKMVISTAGGKIKTSLWEAMTGQNLKADLINDFAERFAWQIDFLTEPRVGDTYKLVWEEFITDDGLAIKGKILAAQYNASGSLHTAVLYLNTAGNEAYFAPDGKSLKRAFLKAPLQYSRISSFFSKKRFHPVLRYFRPHLGIDYAAPSGTPISAIADGIVSFAGRRGGFGNFIELRHTNGYTSGYGHLKGYKKGLRAGMRVSQGQVIGYVGASGLATGPHLDFRMSKNGHFINFLSIKFPPMQSITGKEKESFKSFTKSALTKLADIRID